MSFFNYILKVNILKWWIIENGNNNICWFVVRIFIFVNLLVYEINIDSCVILSWIDVFNFDGWFFCREYMYNYNNCYIKVFYFLGDCVCLFYFFDVVCMYFIVLYDLKYIYIDIVVNIYFFKDFDWVIKKWGILIK